MSDGIRAIRVHRTPDGTLEFKPCVLTYSRPDPLQVAMQRIGDGKTVFAAEADGDALRAWWQERDR